MNNVSMIGRLTADPELKTTTGGTPYVKFSLAVDRRMSKEKKEALIAANKSTTDFPRIAIFGPLSNAVCTYLNKGSLISVTGSVKTDNYDGPDGEKKFLTEILAKNIRFLEPKKQQALTELEEGLEIEVHDDIPF